MSDVYDKTIQGLGAAINMHMLRQDVISGNIANAETPGYKSKKVDFEDALARALNTNARDAMKATEPGHFAASGQPLSRIKPDIYENPDVEPSNDGNTVDMEKEMAALTENSIMFRAAVQLINKKLAALKYAATDGGR